MMAPHDEHDSHDAPVDAALRARFAELRRHDAARAAPFARVVAGRAVQSSRRWLMPSMALGVAALLVVGVGGWWRTRTDDDRALARDAELVQDFARLSGTMRVPTDYFLDLASTVRADEIPTIGAVDWYPLSSAPVDPASGSRRRN